MAQPKKRSAATKRTRKGTPLKPDDERRDELVQIRVSADQKAMFTDAAKRSDLGLSAWLRRLALREVGAIDD